AVGGAGRVALVVGAADDDGVDHGAGGEHRAGDAEGEALALGEHDGAGVSLGQPGGVGRAGQVTEFVVDDAGHRHRVGAGKAGVGDREAVGGRLSLRNGGRAALVHADAGRDVGNVQRVAVGGAGRVALVVDTADGDGVDHRAGGERRGGG